ncbi:MAG: phosphotransferase [Elusimicrobia bacterium]|nr:phosphotransferase [Elusimicrobiota bacterium]
MPAPPPPRPGPSGRAAPREVFRRVCAVGLSLTLAFPASAGAAFVQEWESESTSRARPGSEVDTGNWIFTGLDWVDPATNESYTEAEYQALREGQAPAPSAPPASAPQAPPAGGAPPDAAPQAPAAPPAPASAGPNPSARQDAAAASVSPAAPAALPGPAAPAPARPPRAPQLRENMAGAGKTVGEAGERAGVAAPPAGGERGGAGGPSVPGRGLGVFFDGGAAAEPDTRLAAGGRALPPGSDPRRAEAIERTPLPAGFDPHFKAPGLERLPGAPAEAGEDPFEGLASFVSPRPVVVPQPLRPHAPVFPRLPGALAEAGDALASADPGRAAAAWERVASLRPQERAQAALQALRRLHEERGERPSEITGKNSSQARLGRFIGLLAELPADALAELVHADPAALRDILAAMKPVAADDSLYVALQQPMLALSAKLPQRELAAELLALRDSGALRYEARGRSQDMNGLADLLLERFAGRVGRLREAGEQFLPELERLLASENPSVRRYGAEAAFALTEDLKGRGGRRPLAGEGRLSPRVAELLSPLLRDPDPLVRGAAAFYSGRIARGFRLPTDDLLLLLRWDEKPGAAFDADRGRHSDAILGLLRVPPGEMTQAQVDAVLSVLEEKLGDEAFLSAPWEDVGRLSAHLGPRAERLFPLLAKAYDRWDGEYRRRLRGHEERHPFQLARVYAGIAMGKTTHSDARSVPALLDLLEDMLGKDWPPEPSFGMNPRELVLDALARLGVKAEPHLPRLLAVLDGRARPGWDKEGPIPAWAMGAVREVGKDSFYPRLLDLFLDHRKSWNADAAAFFDETFVKLRDVHSSPSRLMSLMLSRRGASTEVRLLALKMIDAALEEYAVRGQGGFAQHIPELIEFARGTDDEAVHDAVSDLIARAPVESTAQRVSDLRIMLEGAEGVEKELAGDALGRLGPGGEIAIADLLEKAALWEDIARREKKLRARDPSYKGDGSEPVIGEARAARLRRSLEALVGRMRPGHGEAADMADLLARRLDAPHYAAPRGVAAAAGTADPLTQAYHDEIARILALSGSDGAAAAARLLKQAKSAEGRRRAGAVLGELGAPAFDVLAAAAAVDERTPAGLERRRAAVEGLGRLGADAEGAAGLLEGVLRSGGGDASGRLREAAAAALARIGKVDPLASALVSEDPGLRLAAARAAEKAPVDAAAALVDGLLASTGAGRPAAERLAALAALARMRSPGSADTLAGLLGDRDPAVRGGAGKALAALGVLALPTLEKALASPLANARWRAAEALEGIGRPAAEVSEALLRLAESDPDAAVRARALKSLAALAGWSDVDPARVAKLDARAGEAVRKARLLRPGAVLDGASLPALLGGWTEKASLPAPEEFGEWFAAVGRVTAGDADARGAAVAFLGRPGLPAAHRGAAVAALSRADPAFPEAYASERLRGLPLAAPRRKAGVAAAAAWVGESFAAAVSAGESLVTGGDWREWTRYSLALDQRDPEGRVQGFSFTTLTDGAGTARDGVLIVYKDGSLRFESEAGFYAVFEADGRRAAADPENGLYATEHAGAGQAGDEAGGDYARREAGAEVAAWRRDPASGATGGVFYGLAFSADAGWRVSEADTPQQGRLLFLYEPRRDPATGEPGFILRKTLDSKGIWVEYLPDNIGYVRTSHPSAKEGVERTIVLQPSEFAASLKKGAALDFSFLAPFLKDEGAARAKAYTQWAERYPARLKELYEVEEGRGRVRPHTDAIWKAFYGVDELVQETGRDGAPVSRRYRHRVAQMYVDPQDRLMLVLERRRSDGVVFQDTLFVDYKTPGPKRVDHGPDPLAKLLGQDWSWQEKPEDRPRRLEVFYIQDPKVFAQAGVGTASRREQVIKEERAEDLGYAYFTLGFSGGGPKVDVRRLPLNDMELHVFSPDFGDFTRLVADPKERGDGGPIGWRPMQTFNRWEEDRVFSRGERPVFYQEAPNGLADFMHHVGAIGEVVFSPFQTALYDLVYLQGKLPGAELADDLAADLGKLDREELRAQRGLYGWYSANQGTLNKWVVHKMALGLDETGGDAEQKHELYMKLYFNGLDGMSDGQKEAVRALLDKQIVAARRAYFRNTPVTPDETVTEGERAEFAYYFYGLGSVPSQFFKMGQESWEKGHRLTSAAAFAAGGGTIVLESVAEMAFFSMAAAPLKSFAVARLFGISTADFARAVEVARVVDALKTEGQLAQAAELVLQLSRRQRMAAVFFHGMNTAEAAFFLSPSAYEGADAAGKAFLSDRESVRWEGIKGLVSSAAGLVGLAGGMGVGRMMQGPARAPHDVLGLRPGASKGEIQGRINHVSLDALDVLTRTRDPGLRQDALNHWYRALEAAAALDASFKGRTIPPELIRLAPLAEAAPGAPAAAAPRGGLPAFAAAAMDWLWGARRERAPPPAAADAAGKAAYDSLPAAVRGFGEPYYAAVEAKSSARELAALGELTAANPEIWANHDAKHMAEVVGLFPGTLQAAMEARLIDPRVDAPRQVFMDATGRLWGVTHDIWMRDLTQEGRALHPQRAAQEAFNPGFDAAAREMLSWRPGGEGTATYGEILERYGIKAEDLPRVMREIASMSFAHSKSNVPLEILRDPAALREAMLETLQADAGIDSQFLRFYGREGEAPGEARARFKRTAFDWLVSSDAAGKALAVDVIDSARTIRMADAFRSRGLSDFRASQEAVLTMAVVDGEARAVLRLADGRRGYLAVYDDAQTVGEANTRATYLVSDAKAAEPAVRAVAGAGDLVFGMERGLGPKEAGRGGLAAATAKVFIDIYRDYAGSFETAPERRVVLQRPARGDGAFAEAVRAEVLKQVAAEIVAAEAKGKAAKAAEYRGLLADLSRPDKFAFADAPGSPPVLAGAGALEAARFGSDSRSRPLTPTVERTAEIRALAERGGVDVDAIGDFGAALEGARVAAVGAGETLMARGAAGEYVYIPLADAALKVVRSNGYGEVPAPRGVPLGELSVISGGGRNADVVVARPTEVLILPKRTYLRHWLPAAYSLKGLHARLGADYGAGYRTHAFEDALGPGEVRLSDRVFGGQSAPKAVGQGTTRLVFEATLPGEAASAMGLEPGASAVVKIVKPVFAEAGLNARDAGVVRELRRQARELGRDADLFPRSFYDEATGYLFEENLAGYKTLDGLLADPPAGFGPKARESVARQIDDAVAIMDRAGVMHGDLHGGNILVDPKTFAVKVVDFATATAGRELAVLSAEARAAGAFDPLDYNSERVKPHLESLLRAPR